MEEWERRAASWRRTHCVLLATQIQISSACKVKLYLQLTGVAPRDHGGDWQPMTGAGFKRQKRESYGNLKYRIFSFTLSQHRTTTTTTTKAERLNFTCWLKQFSACRLINDTTDLVYSCITWYSSVYRYYFLLTYEFANPIRVRKVCVALFLL